MRDMNKKPAISIAFALAIALFLVLMPLSITKIPAGHVGVVTTFGRVHEEVLTEGMTFLPPWNSVHRMSLQLKENKEKADVPTKEGLTVYVECSVIYSIKKEKAAEIFQTIGMDYEEVLMTPMFRSAIRDATSRFEAKDL